MDFLNILLIISVLVALAIPGFLLKKCNKLDTKATKYLVNIIFYACQPAIVVASFQKVEYSEEILWNMIFAFLFGFFGILFVGFFVLFICKRLFKLKKSRIIAFGAAFGNVAFMGIPFISMAMKDSPEAIIYLTILTIAFNLLSWTLGAYIMSEDKQYISFKKAILNPPTIAIFIALPMFFLKIKLESTVLSGINYIGDMVTPLSMTILGIRFADIKIKELFNDFNIYLVTSLKLIVFPLILYIILYLVPLDPILEKTLFIIFLMPCANNLLLFAEHFDTNVSEAAKAVLFSTMFSVITIPFMLLLKL